MAFTLLTTEDGSLSCRDNVTGELCHNRVGAYTEALKHYAEPSGLIERIRETGRARVLDACFGLGYNTWTLFDLLANSTNSPFTLSVTAIESSPEILAMTPRILAQPIFDTLKIKTDPLEHNTYYRTLLCFLDTKHGDSEGFQTIISVGEKQSLHLNVLLADLRAILPNLSDSFDAVFHDAFSAQKMPELWTMDLFAEYHRFLKAQDGRLLTYSTAAAVRAGLMEAGFQIGKTPALGDKPGGTISAVSQALGEPLSPDERVYLATRAGVPYRDPGLKSSRGEILARRQSEQEASNRPSGKPLRQAR